MSKQYPLTVLLESPRPRDECGRRAPAEGRDWHAPAQVSARRAQVSGRRPTWVTRPWGAREPRLTAGQALHSEESARDTNAKIKYLYLYTYACPDLWVLVGRALRVHVPHTVAQRLGIPQVTTHTIHCLFLSFHMYHAVKVGLRGVVLTAMET